MLSFIIKYIFFYIICCVILYAASEVNKMEWKDWKFLLKLILIPYLNILLAIFILGLSFILAEARPYGTKAKSVVDESLKLLGPILYMIPKIVVEEGRVFFQEREKPPALEFVYLKVNLYSARNLIVMYDTFESAKNNTGPLDDIDIYKLPKKLLPGLIELKGKPASYQVGYLMQYGENVYSN